MNKVTNSIGLIAFLLLVSSCLRELTDGYGGERVEVKLGFNLSAPINAVPDTRATAAPSSFYNLWAFQFNADGAIVGKPQQLSGSQTPVGEGKNLTVSLAVGRNQTIYLFSAGKKLTPNLVDIKTLTELEAYKLDYTTSESGGYTSAVINPEDIPCGGCIKGANVISLGQGAGMLEYDSPTGFSGSISLKQLVAKVTLRYKYTAETHSLQGVRLQNVNGHVSIGNRSPYTPTNGTEFRIFNLQLGAPDAQGYYTASWYVAQNLQGSNPVIASETDRYYKEDGSFAPQYGLCLEVLGKNKTKPSEYSVHRIYVGNNNTTNFDVEAGHHYTLTTDFASAWVEGNTDPRLDVTEFTSAKISFYASARTKTELCTSPTGQVYDLDAHYDFRPISVEASGCSVELGVYSDAACSQLVQMSNKAQNWLQLSVEPNYTLAVNNRTSPLTNRLKVDARAPSKLKFYLYNDEFVDVNPDNSTANRSLYVKISTVELDVSNPKTTTDIFRVDQRPVWVCGRYGGQQNQTNGLYECWLGTDQIEEYLQAYSDETSKVNGLRFGYKVYTAYGDNGWVNGRQATINFSENPDNYTEPSLDSPTGNPMVALPIKVGGKIDLYQYTYYTAYVSRFCYDRNRDLDGSGALETTNSRGENEIKWYLPGGNQGIGIWMENKYLSLSGGVGFECVSPPRSLMHKKLGLIYSSVTYSTGSVARCVRDLPSGVNPGPTLTMETVPNTDTSQGGSRSYPVINAAHGVDRSTQEGFYVDIPLYNEVLDDKGVVVSTTPVMGDDGKQKTVKRIKRYLIDNIIGAVNFSRKFAVSPIINTYSTWMVAGGWGSNASGEDLNTQIAVDKGCPAYRGIDNKDTPGTWRLPTLWELDLISIMRNVMWDAMGNTKFEDGSSYQFMGSFWTATESYSYAMYGDGYPSSNMYINYGSKTANQRYRCVRDLP